MEHQLLGENAVVLIIAVVVVGGGGGGGGGGSLGFTLIMLHCLLG